MPKILKQKLFKNCLIRVLKYDDFIILDHSNESRSLILKTFKHSKQNEAIDFFNQLDEKQIKKLLKNV